MEHIYYIRNTNKQAVCDLLVEVKILNKTQEDSYYFANPGAGMWVEIGHILQMTNDTRATLSSQTIQAAPICDANNVPYWHANLRFMECDIFEYVSEMNPDLDGLELSTIMQRLKEVIGFNESNGLPFSPSRPYLSFA